MDLKDLYQEIILDHGKNPRNLGKFDNYNKDAKGNNPLCGDNVHVYLRLNENKKVEDIAFEGHGCAISMASASIMTDMVRGKEEKEVNPNDEVVEDKGVKVFIDSAAVMYLLGTEMDFKKEKFSSQFVFNNPNETERCGCGESFKI